MRKLRKSKKRDLGIFVAHAQFVCVIGNGFFVIIIKQSTNKRSVELNWDQQTIFYRYSSKKLKNLIMGANLTPIF